MKKLVMVFALGAMLGSCGGDAAEIDVKSLDSACACAEANIEVLTEAKDLYELGQKEGENWDEEKGKEMNEKMQSLEKKYAEIMTKMMEVKKEGEDCPDTGEKLMKLLTTMNEKRGVDFEIPTIFQ
ncbi:MAG: hypothetical protein QNL43_10585 [Crocinitomicaceae bacterium]